MVYLTQSSTYSPVDFNLVNVGNNKSAKIAFDILYFNQHNKANYPYTVTKYDEEASEICLSDGSCWQYNSTYVPKLSEKMLRAGTPAFLGVNSAFDAKNFPNLLILPVVGAAPKVLSVKSVPLPKES